MAYRQWRDRLRSSPMPSGSPAATGLTASDDSLMDLPLDAMPAATTQERRIGVAGPTVNIPLDRPIDRDNPPPDVADLYSKIEDLSIPRPTEPMMILESPVIASEGLESIGVAPGSTPSIQTPTVAPQGPLGAPLEPTEGRNLTESTPATIETPARVEAMPLEAIGPTAGPPPAIASADTEGVTEGPRGERTAPPTAGERVVVSAPTLEGVAAPTPEAAEPPSSVGSPQPPAVAPPPGSPAPPVTAAAPDEVNETPSAAAVQNTVVERIETSPSATIEAETTPAVAPGSLEVESVLPSTTLAEEGPSATQAIVRDAEPAATPPTTTIENITMLEAASPPPAATMTPPSLEAPPDGPVATLEQTAAAPVVEPPPALDGVRERRSEPLAVVATERSATIEREVEPSTAISGRGSGNPTVPSVEYATVERVLQVQADRTPAAATPQAPPATTEFTAPPVLETPVGDRSDTPTLSVAGVGRSGVEVTDQRLADEIRRAMSTLPSGVSRVSETVTGLELQRRLREQRAEIETRAREIAREEGDTSAAAAIRESYSGL